MDAAFPMPHPNILINKSIRIEFETAARADAGFELYAARCVRAPIAGCGNPRNDATVRRSIY